MCTVKTKTSVYQIVHACSVVSDSLQHYGLAHQAPLSMGFPRQEYWSGLPFPSPGDLPNPRIELASPASPVLQVDSLLWSHQQNYEKRKTGRVE